MKNRKPQTLSKFAQRLQPKPPRDPISTLSFTRAKWKVLDEAYHKAFLQAPKLNLP